MHSNYKKWRAIFIYKPLSFLPAKKHKLVVAWIVIHHDDLIADWALAVDGKKPFPIKGLDQ